MTLLILKVCGQIFISRRADVAGDLVNNASAVTHRAGERVIFCAKLEISKIG